MPIKNHSYLSAIPKLKTPFPDESFDDLKKDYASPPTSKCKLNIDGTFLKCEQLATLELPPRCLLLPWLPEGGLVMVAAERGAGKTHFALSLATALSEGTVFMRWPTTQATGVLYVDGEMPLTNIRDRLKIFIPDLSSKSLTILSHEWFYKRTERNLTITDHDIQAALLEQLDADKQLRVVILDNLSSLALIREDKSDDWRQYMLPFLIQCRRRGIAIIIVHHCGKSGEQRGTCAREDHLDTSIMLTRAKDNTHEAGCSFQVSFTKSRDCYGETIASFIATLQTSNAAATWEISLIKESTKDKLINLVRAKGDKGINVTDTAYELGITKGMISRLKKQCEEEGILQSSPRKNPMRIVVDWKK